MDERERYDDICDALTAWHEDVRVGRIFGMPCLKKSGRVVADFTKLAKSASFAAPGAATFAAGCAAGATASPPEMRTMSSIDNTRIRFGITDADS